ncbi:MAG: carbamoyl-phosphate synthase large subunit, partial [Actinobacteria bacterium]|nr:carbamoyl-phosphate synthase large subunit [Actinomycetota bacterium]
MRIPHDGRLSLVQRALWAGAGIDAVHDATNIDPWFLDQICQINELADTIRDAESLDHRLLFRAKRFGFSDTQLGALRGLAEAEVRELRHELGVRPVYKTVDTCAAEFAALTPYHYSSYDEETEVVPSDRDKVIILGSGPNRIGQGIEFDYSCVHAALTLREAGYETIMVNCNPETVSTDYDTSDRLYFEPLTLEDVLEVVHAESSAGRLVGVIVQLGGQTPLGLAQRLKDAGVPIIGTSPESIHLAEERGAFGRVLAEAGLLAPKHGTARTFDEAQSIAADVGYPVLVRPSYVLGGRGMEIVYDDAMLADYLTRSTDINAEHPVLVDRFLDDAVEIDVDAIYDGTELYLAGVMEHIEEAGIHSGDSACALPPITLGVEDIERIRSATLAIARGVGVLGLLNVQYAMAGDVLYVLEANPRASRTVPFVSKATAVPVAKAAARVMVGQSIRDMGIDDSFGIAFAKSQEAAFAGGLPTSGTAFVSLASRDKRGAIFPIKRLADLGFRILATSGTAAVLRRNGVPVEVLRKQHEGRGPNGEPTTVDAIMAGDIQLIVNTPYGVGPRLDGYEIRTAAVIRGVPCITTVQGLAAAVQGIDSLQHDEPTVRSLQEHAAALAVLRDEQDRQRPIETGRG